MSHASRLNQLRHIVSVPDPGVITASTVSAAWATIGNKTIAAPHAAKRQSQRKARRDIGSSELVATGDLADAVVVGVADIDRAVRADHRAMRPVEPGPLGGAAVAV